MPTRSSPRAPIAAVIALALAAACGRGDTKEAASSAAGESAVAVSEKWRLKHEADYRRFTGRLAKVVTVEPIDVLVYPLR